MSTSRESATSTSAYALRSFPISEGTITELAHAPDGTALLTALYDLLRAHGVAESSLLGSATPPPATAKSSSADLVLSTFLRDNLQEFAFVASTRHRAPWGVLVLPFWWPCWLFLENRILFLCWLLVLLAGRYLGARYYTGSVS